MQEQRNRPPRRERIKPSIYKSTLATGQPRFQITYRDSQKVQRWETVEGGVRAAEARLAEIKSRLNRGERLVPNPRLRFEEAAAKYWEGQATRLKPATQAAYGASLQHLNGYFGPSRLDAIDVDAVAHYIARRQSAGAKGWTIKGELTVLSRVFRYAGRSLGSAVPNPVPLLDPSERPRSDEREKRTLNFEELGRLLAAVEPDYQPLFKFAAATGCRLGEVLGLRWGKVDLGRGMASIDHQVDRQGRYVGLKTRRSRRVIELPPTLVSTLREHKLKSPYSGEHEYVFASRSGRPLDHRNVGGRVLARAVARANLGPVSGPDGKVARKAPTFHSLRHSHASLWIAGGGDIVELSARLGHGDPAVTTRIYAHVIEEAGRSEARASKLEAMYGSALAVRPVAERDGEAPSTGA